MPMNLTELQRIRRKTHGTLVPAGRRGAGAVRCRADSVRTAGAAVSWAALRHRKSDQAPRCLISSAT